MALNLSKRFDVGKIPWTERFKEDFPGRITPFGAKVPCWNNPKQKATDASKFAPKGEDGIFLGCHIQPGFIWRQEYVVAFLKGSRDAIENDDLKKGQTNGTSAGGHRLSIRHFRDFGSATTFAR